MAGLTVTEKEHWKNRIANRIDKKIEAISAEDPSLLDRVHREARGRALVSLGLSEMQQMLDAIEAQQADLDKQECRVRRSLLAHVRGVPVEDVDDCTSYSYKQEAESAIRRRQALHEDELLAETDRGRRILELRLEKENLLDTVWLATSNAQIKDLWSKVADLLNDEQTKLQREALAIPPVED